MKACNSCGKCCVKYSNAQLSASAEDIELWQLFRPEITRFVRNGELWFDPITSERITLCPWLEKLPGSSAYHCKIYYDRPEDCRHYPSRVHEMIGDACEMLEAKDLQNLKKAQKELDIIMSDSRPAVDDKR